MMKLNALLRPFDLIIVQELTVDECGAHVRHVICRRSRFEQPRELDAL